MVCYQCGKFVRSGPLHYQRVRGNPDINVEHPNRLVWWENEYWMLTCEICWKINYLQQLRPRCAHWDDPWLNEELNILIEKVELKLQFPSTYWGNQ